MEMPNLILRSRFLCRYDKYLSTIREFVFQDRPNIVRRYRTVAPASTLFANIRLMATCSLQCAIYAFISHALPSEMPAEQNFMSVPSAPCLHLDHDGIFAYVAFADIVYRAYLKTQAGHAAVFSGAFNPGQLASHQIQPQRYHVYKFSAYLSNGAIVVPASGKPANI